MNSEEIINCLKEINMFLQNNHNISKNDIMTIKNENTKLTKQIKEVEIKIKKDFQDNCNHIFVIDRDTCDFRTHYICKSCGLGR